MNVLSSKSGMSTKDQSAWTFSEQYHLKALELCHNDKNHRLIQKKGKNTGKERLQN